MVEPVDPLGGGRFNLFDGPRGLAWSDEFGLVQAVDSFGQGIVIGAADRANGGLDPGLGEPLTKPDRGVLRSSISLVHKAVEIERSLALTGPDRLFNFIEHHCGCHGRRDSPAHNPARVGIDDEVDVANPDHVDN